MTKQSLFGLRTAHAVFVMALGFLLASPLAARADDIENLFSEETVEPTPTPAPSVAPAADRAAPAGAAPRRVGDLDKLEKFEDVAVIQKRYLPRTKRFEIFIGPTLVLNDAFFLNFGGNIRLAYHFSERYGIEAVGDYLSTNERQITTDLHDKRSVITKSFVTPQTYAGVDFKWSPIYGKMTWLNRTITPFDHYFSFGLGMTGTNQSTSELTGHIGTGQIFAQSKGIAWRWDFSWNAYRATSSVNPAGGASFYHNLLLTFGASFYFPEASYR